MERATCTLVLILAVITLVQCRTLVPIAEERLAESNRYIDFLVAKLRTDSHMRKYDPMTIPQERFDHEKGHGVLNKTTATGLTSIDRYENVTISDYYNDLTFLIKAVLKTNEIRVCSHLTAITHNGKTIDGQVYGSIPSLTAEIDILVWPNGTALMVGCQIPFLHMTEAEFAGDKSILQENCNLLELDNEAELSGDKYTLQQNCELMDLVNEALEYVVKIKHSAYIHRVVTSIKQVHIQGMIDNFVGKTKIPISI